MANNFESILDTPAEAMKVPTPLPVGEYIFLVTKPPALKEITAKADGNKSTVAEFECRPVQADKSVDRVELEAYGWPTDRTQRLSFYITEAALYRLKNFVKDVLEVPSADNMTARQMLAEIPGKQFRAPVTHRPSPDGTRFYSEINSNALAKA